MLISMTASKYATGIQKLRACEQGYHLLGSPPDGGSQSHEVQNGGPRIPMVQALQCS